MKIYLTSALLACSLYSCAQIPNDVISKKCDSIFNNYNSRPGVAVLIVQDGKIAFEKGYGLASLEYNVPITPTTVFDIASVSKQFTGYAISTLIQEGKLSPDDDIHKYLPDVPDFGKKITVRNLIHHTSGLRDWPEGLHAAGWRWEEAFSWDDIMRMVKQQKELDFEPGSRYQYSNTGYNLLAAIVEKVTGKTLPVWVNENIFKPLQMNSSQVLTDYSKVIKNAAGSYYEDGSKYHKSSDMLTAWGSSSIFTTVEDLSKWAIRLQKGWDEKDPVYMRLIETDNLNNGEKNDYAYGNEVMDDQGLLNINHTGGWASFATVISTYPSQKISIILLSNNGSFDSYGKANNVARALFGDKFKTAGGSPKGVDWGSNPTVKVEASILQKYTNTYKLGDGWYATFTLEDGRLMVQASGEAKFPTEPKSDTVIWVPAYNSAFFFRDITDKANTAKYKSIIAPRITPVKIDASQFGQYTGNYYSAELEATYRVYVKNGKLMVHHMRLGDFELTPDIATEGVFGSDAGRIQFDKDAQRKIIGFRLSGGRIRNIRFEKQ
ncbi:MAG TPA: serine hydrolase domain-containing protein [Mucilaginibacter sp.]|jgi:CubicO group peptidase (beta-lactamase class C family)|nr:serine hydrolase domain-containing protein [Mucilaginibacter sp.]